MGSKDSGQGQTVKGYGIFEAGAVPRGPGGPRPPVKFVAPLWPPKKVQDKAPTYQNYVYNLI